MDIEVLEEFGLTKNESKVYLELLSSGKSLAGTLAEKTDIHRRNVYDTLKRLIEKGFVTHHKKGKKEYYLASSPEKIKEMLKEKMDIANKFLPKLLNQYNKTKEKKEVEVLEGKEGMKNFFSSILKHHSGHLYSIGATGKGITHLPYFIEGFKEDILKEEIKLKNLKNYNAKEFKPIEDLPNSETRTLPNKFATPTQIFLFGGEYSTIAIWSEDPLAIRIRSKEIYKGFKKYFDFMWEISKED